MALVERLHIRHSGGVDPALQARGISQRKLIHTYVQWHQTAYGTGPTMPEVVRHLGVSRPAVRRHLMRLISEGALTYAPYGTIEIPPRAIP